MINASFILKATGFIILTEVVYHISRRLGRKLMKKNTKNSLTYCLKQIYDKENEDVEFNKVLFFPDSGIACRRTLSGRPCRDEKCNAVHEETSLSALINVLKLCKQTLDVCVYMITCSRLGDALVDCQNRGIILRVITEERNSGEEGEMAGSQIGKLRAAGILVRCRSSSFWMHHKFLVADNEILVNGSFNWTNQAVMGNLENLIITSEKRLVQPFMLEFQRLWDMLAPAEFIEDDDIRNCNVQM